MNRKEIIRNTAAEIVALHEQDALDELVVEVLLQTMALEIDNLAFVRHMETLNGALKAMVGRA